MNRFFHREEYRREIPSRVYARLDETDPISFTYGEDLILIFDAVDADWEGFAAEKSCDLSDPDLEYRIKNYWSERFGNNDNNTLDQLSIYDEVPIFRLEIPISEGHDLYKKIFLDDAQWITFDLSHKKKGLPAQVYGGLFAPPISAFIQSSSETTPSGQLTVLFDMTSWPDASSDELNNALKSPCKLEALVCLDVGQGSASALICECGLPIYYFDTGCGSGRNAPTAPATIDFYTCCSPTVILSHWDTDHWAAASNHGGLQTCNWVMPRQTISTTHTAFANEILKSGGKILVVGNNSSPLIWSSRWQHYHLERATGKNRNNSGLVLIVTDNQSKRSWVLTGDASYNFIAQDAPQNIAALVVPHHGADLGKSSTPFSRPTDSYARLFYSFGPDNAHGPKKPPTCHPVPAAIITHQKQGWDHGSWSSTTPAQSLAGGDVIATASHPSSHLAGGAAGWDGPPSPQVLKRINSLCNSGMGRLQT